MKPDNPSETVHDVLDALRSTLLQWVQWGCRGFECPAEALARLEGWSNPGNRRPRCETLEDIRSSLGDCRRCPLCRNRTNLVFGEGDPRARLVFVGEAPGQEEDRSGRPFVGAAGQLLNRIIEAMGLTRGQVYICNLIKCRPPDNRNPLPDEVQACRPCLDRQLAALKPEVICALGTFAAQSLLATSTPISGLRGRFHTYNGIKVMPTFHPAYLLRNPEQKRLVWEDIKMIMALLDIQR